MKKIIILLSLFMFILFGCEPIFPPQIKMTLEVEHLTDELIVAPSIFVTNPRAGFHSFDKDEYVLLSIDYDSGYDIKSWIIYDSDDNFIGEFDNEYNLKMDGNYRAIADIVCNSDDVCIGDYNCVNQKCVLDIIENCISTDGGKNYFEKGITSNNSVTKMDYCISPNVLVEYYCEEDKVVSELVYCTGFEGRCLNGACVSYDEFCEAQEMTQLQIFSDSNMVLSVLDKGEITQIPFNSNLISSVSSNEGLLFDAGGEIIYNSLNEDLSFHTSPNNKYIIVYDVPSLADYYSDFLLKLDVSENINFNQYGEPIQSSSYNNLLNIYNENKNSLLSQIDQINNEVLKFVESSNLLDSFNVVFSGALVEASFEDIMKIRNQPFVKEIYPDLEVQVLLHDSISQIDADIVHGFVDSEGNYLRGQGVTIAILDTGIDHNHPDLGGCLGDNCKVIESIDFTNTIHNGIGIDDHGHGTHVAATAAGNGSLIGVAPDASLISYKVLDSRGRGSTSSIISAIERAMDPNQDGFFDDHIDIISLSLGNRDGFSNNPMSLAIDSAVNVGVIAVIAAGNEGRRGYQTIGSPGTSRRAITVAAVDKNNLLASFSSKGPTSDYVMKPDVSAPGVDICAAQWNNWLDNLHCFDSDEHIAISGTSMSTPHVSGLAALLLQNKPYLSPEEIKSILMQSSKNEGHELNELYELEYGAGIIDSLNAIDMDVVVTPSHFELANKDEEFISKEAVVSNYGDSPRLLVFKELNAINSNQFTDPNINFAPVTTLCLEPGETETVELDFEFGVVELETKGFTIGRVLVKEYDCSSSNHELIKERDIVFSNRNLYDLEININLKNPEFFQFGRLFIFDDYGSEVINFETDSFNIGLLSLENVLIGYRSQYYYPDTGTFTAVQGFFDLEEDLVFNIDEALAQKLSYELPDSIENTVAYEKTFILNKNDYSLGWTAFIPTLCPQFLQDFVSFYSIGTYDFIEGVQIRGPPSRYVFNSNTTYILYSNNLQDNTVVFDSDFTEYHFTYDKEILDTLLHKMIGGFGPLRPGAQGGAFWSTTFDNIVGEGVFEKTVYLHNYFGGLFTGASTYSRSEEDYDNWAKKRMYSQSFFSSDGLDDLNFFKNVSFDPSLELFHNYHDNFEIIHVLMESESESLFDENFKNINFRIFYEDGHFFTYLIEGPSQTYAGEEAFPLMLICDSRYRSQSIPQISCETGTYYVTQYFDEFDNRLSPAQGEFCWTGENWFEGACT